MQADVSGQAASTCAAHFYQQLVAGKPVDVAITRARGALLFDYSEQSREPYLPVLTTRTFVDQIISVPKYDWPEWEQERWLKSLDTIWEHFVDQRPYRRQLFDALLGAAAEKLRSALIVRGDNEVGKTWLLRWCRYALALRSIRTHYVSIRLPTDWLEIIRQIRDGDATVLSPGLNNDVRDEFNWKLNHLARGQIPPAFPTAPVVDEAGSLGQIRNRREHLNDFASHVCEAMQVALKAETVSSSFVLILDNWSKDRSGVSTGDFTILKNNLFDPLVAGGQSSPMKIILCFNNSDVKEYELVDFSSWKEFPISAFEAGDVGALARELVRLQFPRENTERLEKNLAELGAAPMTAGELYKLCNLLGKALGLK